LETQCFVALPLACAFRRSLSPTFDINYLSLLLAEQAAAEHQLMRELRDGSGNCRYILTLGFIVILHLPRFFIPMFPSVSQGFCPNDTLVGAS
jgi:hypothetical protein